MLTPDKMQNLPNGNGSIWRIAGPIVASVAFILELVLAPMALPAIQEEFSLSNNQIAWIYNSYGAAVAIGVIFGGVCGDLFSINRIFSCGVMAFLSGSILITYSTSFEHIVAWRTLQGLGGGVFSPIVPVLLVRGASKRPGKALVVWGCIIGLVASCAPFLTGLYLARFDWTIMFIAAATIASASLVIFAFDGSYVTPAERRAFSFPTFRRSKAQALISMFVYVFATYGLVSYFLFSVPLRLSHIDIGAAEIGFIMSALWMSFTIFNFSIRNLVDKAHIRFIVLVAPVLLCAGILISGFSSDVAEFTLASILIGAGLALSNSPSTLVILSVAPKEIQAISASIDITFARLGGVATVALISSLNLPADAAVATSLQVFLCLAALVCGWTAFSSLKGSVNFGKLN